MRLFNSKLKKLGLSLSLLCAMKVHSADILGADIQYMNVPETTKIISASLPSPWEFQFAPRYWYSSGNYKKTLYGFTKESLISRLVYSEIEGQTAEGFWQLNHLNGLFLKGYFGGGSLMNGHMNDEDFPPYIDPYSNTYHRQKNGNIDYLSIDVGYNWGSESDWRLGTFLGYHFWNERLNTFGCNQLQNDSLLCGKLSPFSQSIPKSVNVLSNDAEINSLRVGINGQFHLLENLSFSSDLAYVRSHIRAHDFHNLRPDIRNILEEGRGNGVQWEGVLNWYPSQELSLGLGGRWWYIPTEGFTRTEQTARIFNLGPQIVQLGIERYGVFLEANYQFNDLSFTPLFSKSSFAPESELNWSGLYMGPNIGYGTNPRIIYIRSLNSLNKLLPYNLNVQEAGFLGGGQIGYNHQLGKIIFGLEADMDYANLAGANATTSMIIESSLEEPSFIELNSYTTTVNKELKWLSTVRGRVGKLISQNVLTYLTGGVGIGRVKLDFDQRMPGIDCSLSRACSTGTRSQTKNGWIAGGGIEYAVNSISSLKAEYLYTGLGKTTLNTQDQGILRDKLYNVTSKFNYNVIRLGANFRF